MDAAQEGRLVVVRVRLQFLQSLGFLRDRRLPLRQLMNTAFERSPLRRILPFQFVLAGLQIIGSRARSFSPVDQSNLLRFYRLLAFVERGFALLRGRVAFL